MIIGHEAIRSRLWRAVEKQCAAQTYLFVGPENIGKLAVALELGEQLLGTVAHSDCVVIRPERVEEKGKVKELPIRVKTIREATRTLGLSGRVGTKAVLIVDDAHKMSEGAQNAFLKTLEEPFPGATIILVTHDEGGILSTILSRCERVSFSLLPGNVMEESFPDVPEVLRRLGRPGLCVSFREQPDVFSEHIRRLEQLQSFSSLPMNDRAMLADACVSDVAGAERLFAWWMSALNRELITDISTEDRRAILEQIHMLVATLRDLRRFSGSARLIMEHFFFFRKSVSPLLARNMTKVGLAR